MMELSAMILQILLAAVLAVAAIGKFFDLADSRRAVKDFGVPERFADLTAGTIGPLAPGPAGARLDLDDMLQAMLLPSGNNVAYSLAIDVGKSVPRFVALMNHYAHLLHLGRTHFTTPIGLDTPGNYSTAWDLASLARYLLRAHPFFRHTVALSSAVLRSGAARRVVLNRNDLVGRIPWINGVKTGHTLDAGYVLVGSGTRDGMTLISVVLGTSSMSARDSNTLALLGYGFHRFRQLTPVRAGRVLGTVAVRGRPRLRATLVATRSFARVFLRSQAVRTVVQAPAVLTGPIAAHTVVGSVLVETGGRVIARVPLAVAQTIPAPPPNRVTRPFTLIAIAAVLAAVLASIAWQLKRARAHRTPA